MKNLKVIFFFLCVCIFNSYAQDHVLYEEIQQAKSSGENFESVLVLTPADKSALQNAKDQEYFINPQEVHVLHYNQSAAKSLHPSMTLSVPLAGKNLQLELQENIMGYRITTSDGQKTVQNRNIRHYHGVVKDDPHSIVAITFGEDEIMGLVATDEGNFNLALDRQSGEHIFYNEKNLKQKPEFTCGTIPDNYPDVYTREMLLQNTRYTTSTKTVRLYFETEFDIFQTRGSVASVETFITGIYNQVAVLYRNESITTALSEIHVWSTQDPYTDPNIYTTLTQFQNTRTSFNGDLGQLLTFRNIGGGLAAEGFNGLCNSDISKKLSVAMLYNNFSNVPNYSWSVQVVTHELGHLFGSRHTHACVWNGNNTAIDGCAGYTEATVGNGYGSCPVPGIPYDEGGTIMSYCHEQPSVGINFNLGFGPQPGNVIRNSVQNANCLIIITGPDMVCYDGSAFTLSNAPAGTITWSVSWPFTVSGNGTMATVTRITSAGTGNGTLTARVNGTVVATKTIVACPPASINGSSAVCSSRTYTLNNPPADVIYWTISNPGLFSVSPSGSSTTVTRNMGYGTATLSARIGSAAGTEIAFKVIESVNSNSFPSFGEQPVQYLSCGESVYIAPPYAAGIAFYAWTYYFVASYNFSFSGSYDNQWQGLTASAAFYENGYYVFDGYAYNACSGQSYDASIRYIFEVTGCNSSSVGFAYPNPVSGILTIDVDAAVAARSQPAVQSITGAQSLKPAAAYDLRLYDGQGNLMRQRKATGGTVEFNVANLPNGVYYLHIYDATDEKPTMQQIVVEH